MRYQLNSSLVLVLILIPLSVFFSCGPDTDLEESDLVGSWRIVRDVNGIVDRTKSDEFYTFNEDHTYTGYYTAWGKRYKRRGTWELKPHHTWLLQQDKEKALLILHTQQGDSESSYLKRNGDTLTMDRESEPDYAGMIWVYERAELQAEQRFQQRSPRTSGVPNLMTYALSSLSTIGGILLLLLLVRWFFIRGKNLTILSRWHHLYGNLNQSSKEFYTSVEAAIKSRNVPDTQLSRVNHHEGGMFSANREYLRVRRKEYVFDICAAPFGNSFFFSYWLGEKPSAFWNLILLVPVLGPWLFVKLRPATYYRLDTATMFGDSIHSAVMEVLDGITKEKGLRSLSELERKPIMMDLYKW